LLKVSKDPPPQKKKNGGPQKEGLLIKATRSARQAEFHFTLRPKGKANTFQLALPVPQNESATPKQMHGGYFMLAMGFADLKLRTATFFRVSRAD